MHSPPLVEPRLIRVGEGDDAAHVLRRTIAYMTRCYALSRHATAQSERHWRAPFPCCQSLNLDHGMAARDHVCATPVRSDSAAAS